MRILEVIILCCFFTLFLIAWYRIMTVRWGWDPKKSIWKEVIQMYFEPIAWVWKKIKKGRGGSEMKRLMLGFALVVCLMLGMVENGLADPLDTWVKQDSGTNAYLWGVAYGNGMYVVIGDKIVLTSPDAVTWTPHSLVDGSNYSIIYANNTFVTSRGLASYNGTTFTVHIAIEDGLSVAYGNNTFVIVGHGPRVYTSPTTANWTGQNPPIDTDRYVESLNDVMYINNMFVAVGEYSGIVYTSPDGVDWTKQDSSSNLPPQNYGQALAGISYGNDRYIAVGGFHTGYLCYGLILTSPDVKIWNPVSIGYPTGNMSCLSGITYGGDNFVAVGPNGTILSSSDGNNWVERNSGVTVSLNRIVHVNNRFIAVGEAGTILTSDTAHDLTVQKTGTGTGTVTTASGSSSSKNCSTSCSSSTSCVNKVCTTVKTCSTPPGCNSTSVTYAQGINCGTTCQTDNGGSSKTYLLAETPGIGSKFVSWLGCDSIQNGMCLITVDGSDKTITATFNKK